ncbi:MAG TPA: signal peptidase II [Candidatus Binatia bacterium]|nr:signal peptidase II [Candidatus Binatia bacterium]
MVKRVSLFWIIAIAIAFLDQFTKWLVIRFMPVGNSIALLPFFSLTHIKNTGAGFGILQGQNAIFILIALIAIVVIVLSLRKILEKHHTTIFAALILGGAVGNLVDRILLGAVTDFINFTFWPAFNVADSALTLGVLGLIWMSMKEKK